MELPVIILDKQVKKFNRTLLKIAKRLSEFLPKKGEIELYIINGRRMRNLNKRFRGKDKPTNVLSFQKPKNFPGIKLGEIYLDPIYIRRHKEDLALMLVHGVLHILGYDHEKKSDRIKMENKEKRLLKQLSGNF
ncbi:MAG: rRNA maturation RNase YbeY [Candidatus Harrisonbacteria bacterium]|nr:rRNA maturation RNase YbeY [Candidatus Harrisonbacteria bacterium]